MQYKYIFSADLSDTNTNFKKDFKSIDNIALTSRRFNNIDECFLSARTATTEIIKQVEGKNKICTAYFYSIEDDDLKGEVDYPDWTTGEVARITVFENVPDEIGVIPHETDATLRCETRIYEVQSVNVNH